MPRPSLNPSPKLLVLSPSAVARRHRPTLTLPRLRVGGEWGGGNHDGPEKWRPKLEKVDSRCACGFPVDLSNDPAITRGVCQGFFGVDGATDPSGEGPEGPSSVTGVSDMGGLLRSWLSRGTHLVRPEPRGAQR